MDESARLCVCVGAPGGTVAFFIKMILRGGRNAYFIFVSGNIERLKHSAERERSKCGGKISPAKTAAAVQLEKLAS